MVSEGACAIVWTFYFVVINRNAFYFIYFTVFINILALFSCFYLTESPRYLFGMEKFDECRNGKTDYIPPVFEDETV